MNFHIKNHIFTRTISFSYPTSDSGIFLTLSDEYLHISESILLSPDEIKNILKTLSLHDMLKDVLP